MAGSTRCRRRRFFRNNFIFESVANLFTPRRKTDSRVKSSLRLTSLEDRLVPTGSLDVTMLDAIGYAGKTVALTLTHTGSGSSAGTVDWGDGGGTDSLSGWSYSTSTKVFTHTYSTPGAYKVIATDTKESTTDNQSLSIVADVPPAMPVDVDTGMSFPTYVTPTGNNPTNISSGSVRYADGVIRFNIADMTSTGFGMPFGQSRSWSNGPGYDQGGDNGNGWVESMLPSVSQVEGTDTLAVIVDGINARTFDLRPGSSTVYDERFFGQNRLTHDVGAYHYVLITSDGVTYVFNDFSSHWNGTPAAKGQFVSRTDPYGNLTEVTDRNADGNVEEISRGSGAEVWSYEYYDDGDNEGKLQRVSWQKVDGGTTTLRKVEYEYYGTSDDNGNLGDLKTATIKDDDENVLSTQYFRFYKPGEDKGFAGALKMYVGFASYERANGHLTISSAADSALDDYADFYLEYDAYRRVSLEKVQGMGCSMCSAGIGEYSFSYDPSLLGTPAGVNRWSTKTTETLPDGNENIVYSNAFGQVMLTSTHDVGNDDEWIDHYLYDGQGRLARHDHPSAVTGYDDSTPELVTMDGVRIGLSTEFRANTTTSGGQVNASVGQGSNGDYVIAWQSSDGSNDGIWAQRYNRAGQPLGSEIAVNTTTSNKQIVPSVAVDSLGDFVIVWQSYGQDKSGYGVYGQRFDAAGAKAGGEFAVNVLTTGNQNNAAVAMDDDGDFVVTWSDYDNSNVYARHYNPAGSGDTPIVVNSTTFVGGVPSIAMDLAGDFAIAWDAYDTVANEIGIFVRRFDNTGKPLASEVKVNTTTDSVWSPNVAMDEAGDMMVAWTQDSGGSAFSDVFARKYTAAGSSWGSQFVVNTTTINDQTLQNVATDAVGDFLIVWSDQYGDLASSAGIVGRYFPASGSPSSEIHINTYTTGTQMHQAVSSDYDGNFVVTWASNGQDGSGYGIYARQLERTFADVDDDDGLIDRYFYGRSTTATSSPGDVAGYLSATWLQHGDTGVDVNKQSSIQYFEKTYGDLTVHPLASNTVYRNDDGTGSQTTSFAYDYIASSVKIETITVTYPTVTTSQNGPNSADTEASKLDGFARLSWFKDGDGHITYREYDDASGAVTKRIDDVDTDEDGDYEGSAPWTNKSGLHLISTFAVDFLGRTTASTDPIGVTTYTVFLDSTHEVRVYPGWDATLNGGDGGPTGPTQVYREFWLDSFSEQLTTSNTPAVEDDVPTGAETIDTVQSATRWNYNNAGQVISTDQYWNLDGLDYYPAIPLGSINTNYYRTNTDYAARGGVKRTETGTGTITWYIRDAMNRVTDIWMGTNDKVDTGTWSPTNTKGDADLVKIESFVYDGDDVGDENLTSDIKYPGGGGIANRQTDLYYDWRDRPVAIKQGVEGSESATLDTNRPLYTFTYDNLNEITRVYQFDGDNLTPTISGGELSDPTSSARRAEMRHDYDERGREYRTHLYEINPSTGGEGRILDTDMWYDRRGNVIKILQTGGLVIKAEYDGVDRMTAQYCTDGGSDPAPGDTSNWSHADDETDDTVYQELHYQFDDSGKIVKTTTKERKPTASGTDKLGDFDTQPYARVSFTGNYYDKANRLTATVDLGVQSGDTWTYDPESIPGTDDDKLVTSFDYGAAGDVTLTTDPRGIKSQQTYDLMGRLTEEIDGYNDGVASGGDDMITDYEYDGMNHVVLQTRLLDSKNYEQTQFAYGVEAGKNGNTISSNDLLSVIYYPDAKSGDPGPAQYSYSYNAVGDRIGMTDINDTEHQYLFDVVGRPVADNVLNFGEGILEGIKALTTAYDSAGHPYLFSSIDGDDKIANQLKREFNGFGQMTKEYQDADSEIGVGTPVVTYAYSSSGNKSNLDSMTYPHGEVMEYSYDAIGRVDSVTFESNPEETLTYLGLATVVGRTLGDGLLSQSVTLDNMGRVGELKWVSKTPETIEDFTYGYDRDGNVLYRTRVDTKIEDDLPVDHHDFDELYHASGKTADADKYSLLNQVTGWSLGELSITNSDSRYNTVAKHNDIREYQFDGVGNIVDGTNTRTFDKQNRLATHDSKDVHYDDVGNLIEDDATNTYAYDAWNRLVSYNSTDRYGYDATGRRNKVGDHVLLLDQDGNILEERHSGDLVYQNKWSRGQGHAMDGRLTYADDKITVTIWAITIMDGSVMTITDESGVANERYVYDPKGQIRYLTGDWETPLDAGESAYDWNIGWHGWQWDSEIEIANAPVGPYNPRIITLFSPSGDFKRSPMNTHLGSTINSFALARASCPRVNEIWEEMLQTVDNINSCPNAIARAELNELEAMLKYKFALFMAWLWQFNADSFALHGDLKGWKDSMDELANVKQQIPFLLNNWNAATATVAQVRKDCAALRPKLQALAVDLAKELWKCFKTNLPWGNGGVNSMPGDSRAPSSIRGT